MDSGAIALSTWDTEPAISLPERLAREPRDPLASLVPRALDGDRECTERLVRAVAPRVLQVAKSVLGPRHPDVDDLVQDSLVAFVRALRAFEGRSSLPHYAARIAVRVCIAGRRRARAERRVSPDEHEHGVSDTTGQRPFRQLLRERRRVMVRRLVEELPEPQAETVALRICMGLPVEEVAAITGVPLNTVYSRLRLAKEALRGRIAKDPVLRDILGGDA